MVGTSALAKPDLIRTEIQRKQEIEEVYALSVSYPQHFV